MTIPSFKQEFHTRIAKMADTKTQKIDASISSRVTKLVLDELASMKGWEVAELLKRAE